jgi:hypothetical protein
MNIISNGYRFRRGTGTPFAATTNKDYDFGGTEQKPVRWCDKCQLEVQTLSASYNQAQVWAQKHWCRRCGHVIMSAVYFHAKSIAEQPVQLFEKARAWAADPQQKG